MSKILVYIIMIFWLLNLFGCKTDSTTNKNTLIPDSVLQNSLEDFEKRPLFKKLSKELLKSTEDNELNQVIFDNIAASMDDDNRSEAEILREMTKGQQVVYSIWIVEGEVNNGGFNQLYFNGYEEIAKISEDGFATIGAIKFAQLVKKANAKYQQIKPDLEKYDDDTSESFRKSYNNNPLNTLDTEFYDLYKTENIEELMIKYIRNNQEEFVQE